MTLLGEVENKVVKGEKEKRKKGREMGNEK